MWTSKSQMASSSKRLLANLTYMYLRYFQRYSAFPKVEQMLLDRAKPATDCTEKFRWIFAYTLTEGTYRSDEHVDSNIKFFSADQVGIVDIPLDLSFHVIRENVVDQSSYHIGFHRFSILFLIVGGHVFSLAGRREWGERWRGTFTRLQAVISWSLRKRKMPLPCARAAGFMIQIVSGLRLNSSTNRWYSD